MLQAAAGDGLALDAASLLKDGLPTPKIGVGGREIIQALMIEVVIVVRHKGRDAAFEITRQI